MILLIQVLLSLLRQIYFNLIAKLPDDAEEPFVSMVQLLNHNPLKSAKERLDTLVKSCEAAGISRLVVKDHLDMVKKEAATNSWLRFNDMVVKWLWKNWIAAGFITLIAGEPGSCKSFFSLALCKSFICGTPLPDNTPFTASKGKVLYIDTENAQAINIIRARAMGIPFDEIIFLYDDDPFGSVNLVDLKSQKAIRAKLAEYPVKLVVIDSLRGAHHGDENSSDMIHIMNFLAKIAREFEIPIICVQHLRKKSTYESSKITMDRIRGSSTIPQMARTIIAIDAPYPGNKSMRKATVIKNNLGDFPPPIGLRVNDNNTLSFCIVPAPKISPRQKIVEWLDKRFSQTDSIASAEILAEATQLGFCLKTLASVKKELGIPSDKQGRTWDWIKPADPFNAYTDESTGSTANNVSDAEPTEKTEVEFEGEPEGEPYSQSDIVSYPDNQVPSAVSDRFTEDSVQEDVSSDIPA